MHTWYRRMAVAALTVTTLVLSTPGGALAQTPTDDPLEAAAGWLATQLADGERIEVVFGDDTFPDAGLTADVVFALAAAGVAADSIASATDWLETQVGAYTGADFDATFAGSTSKLLVVAATTDRDPRAFGGTDLVAQLEGLETPSGRFSDDATDPESGDPADYSNTITQALAVIGLERAGDGPSTAAVAYLAGQACEDGGFPIVLDGEECDADVDATAFAVQALASVGDVAAVAAGVRWLVDAQLDDGSFSGNEGPNSNSTGLAAAALEIGGERAAASSAADWLRSRQLGCTSDAPGAIAFDADDSGDRLRATAQAVLGLAGVSLAEVEAAGAADTVPVLACPDDGSALATTGGEGRLMTLIGAGFVTAGVALVASRRRVEPA